MYIKLSDVRLFFDVEGSQLAPEGSMMRERPTLVCLHGGPGLDHSSLRIPLSPLASVAQIIYLDQRGHGRSDWSDPQHWSLSQWAQDLREFIDALSISNPIVLGMSFGGYVAMTYATRYPDHPAKLILISTAARGSGHPQRRARVLDTFERLGGVRAREAADRALRERSIEAYAYYSRVCGPLYSHASADLRAFARMIVNDEVMPFFERPGGEGEAFDLSHELAGVRCPTLVLGGEDDPITPIGEQREIVDALPAALTRFESFARCGHSVWCDDGIGFIRAVEEFISA